MTKKQRRGLKKPRQNSLLAILPPSLQIALTPKALDSIVEARRGGGYFLLTDVGTCTPEDLEGVTQKLREINLGMMPNLCNGALVSIDFSDR
mgnify:CR=1 FL=1